MNSLLLEFKRNGFTEIAVHGFVSIYDGEKIIYQSADWDGEFPARSLLKPFQFLASGVPAKFEAGEKLAAGMGSLSSTPEQVATLQKWYSDDQISKVKAPVSYPMDEESRVLLKVAQKKASILFQPCLGKHLAILDGCVLNHWPLDSYLEESHPFHQKLTETLQKSLKVKRAFSWVTDGCLLPSPVLRVSEIAELYQKVAEGQGEFKKIQKIIMDYPEWIGGPNRFDTRLMQINPGKVIAKEGADGLLGVAILPTEKFPRGLGIVSKIDAGYVPNLMFETLAPIFQALGLKAVSRAPKGQSVTFHYQPFESEKNTWIDISPTIHSKLAVWPGDIAFKRNPSMETSKGAHMTLSSLETTVHLGTHTDSPVHFEKDGVGIESVELSKYIGTVQIIEVPKKLNGVILVSDLDRPAIRADRVLFKTGSSPVPTQFNEDFMSLSKELVEFLGKKNVKLVGIDTPSIDPFSSKELPAHHETTVWNMGILEGVVLEKVKPGIYFMSALPLKIEGADASPVRVALKPISL